MQCNIPIDTLANDCCFEQQDFVAHTVATKAGNDNLTQEELDYLDQVMEIHDYRYLPWI